MASLIAIGDNVVDNYLDKGVYYPGGNAVNVAVFAKRYGTDRSAYIGLFGNDEEGAHVQNALQNEGIEITRCRTAIGENGKAYVRHDAEGDRVFGKSNKGGVQALLKLNLTEEDLKYVGAFSLMHTSVYSYLDESIAQLNPVIPISYDFSTVLDEARIQELSPLLEVAFFSGSDKTREESARFARCIHALGAKHVVVTRGKEGAIYVGVEGEQEIQVTPVKAVDTLGAGDSFIAAFLVNLIEQKDISACLSAGAECAAATCLEEGAFGYPKAFTNIT